MKNLKWDWLSFLKLRGSWGMLGNERIGSNYFPYIALMSFGNSLFYMADGSVVSDKTARPAVLAVEDITWETTTSTDLGLDVNFLNNRLQFHFDYYWKETKDMLLNIEIPYFMGYNNPSTNAGKMSTHGYDIEVAYLEGPCARVISGCNDPGVKKVAWIHIEQHTAERAAESFRSVMEAKACYQRFDRIICVYRCRRSVHFC